MADRRMFTKKVTDDDNFMSLSSSAQALYLHLSMSADDDGFCNQVSLSMFKAHASVQDLEALLDKRYIYQFENGVIVIKHWRMANALRKDRYTATTFQEELKQLKIKSNGAYTMNADEGEDAWLTDGCQMVADRLPDGCRSVADRLPQDSIGKDSIGKVSIGKDINNINNINIKDRPVRHRYGEYGHVLLTDDQYRKLCEDYGEQETQKAIKKVDEYCQQYGKSYKDYNLTLRKWGFDKPKNDRFSFLDD